MPLTPDEERRIEELLSETYNEGVQEGTRNSLFRVIESTARRLLQEDFSAAARLLDRVGLQALRQALTQEVAENWIPRWVRRMVPVLEASMREITRPRERDLGQRFTVTNPNMREYLDNYVLELASQVTETTRRKVENIVSEAIEDGSSTEETAKRIRDVSEEISDTRANTIARTELNRSSNAAAFLQALESGVISEKIWHNAGDLRVRDAHERMEGESVSIEATFSNGLLFPSEVNCRCWLEFVPDFEAIERKRDEEEVPDLSEAEQAVVDILAPDGELIGEPSRGRGVRELPGGLPAAQAMFDELSQYGRPIQGQGMPDGGVVQIAPKQSIAYRPSSKKGDQEPTINVTIEALPDLRKLKFVDE